MQTPLRKNMPENQPISNAHGDIETVIGQLPGRFMQKLRARDLWHLSHRFMRKILAYNFCFVINKQLGNPLL
ncbi:Transposase [Moraxella catarrhalis]|nr:Transposase [Moraxella catarrhalis]